jgi:hypothetical protein
MWGGRRRSAGFVDIGGARVQYWKRGGLHRLATFVLAGGGVVKSGVAGAAFA